jgi:hypothetical protein
MISVNPFYLEYVPFERTRRAVEISTGIFKHNAIVYQVEYYRRFQSMGINGKVSFEKYLQLENRLDFARNTEFFIMGRAPYSLSGELAGLYPNFHADDLVHLPCYPPFLRTWHNHFDNYGNFIPGFCGGISLGDCRELDELLKNGIELDEYPVLEYLIREDFRGLLEFSLDQGYKESEAGYYSKCHLCVDLRKYLHDSVGFRELTPEAFYANLA